MYPTLETARIILRPFTENDAEHVYDLVRAFDEQMEIKQFTQICSIEDAKKLNDETVKSGVEWMIVHKETQKPIGWVICNKALGFKILKRTYISAWIREEYQHKGLGREILDKVLHFAFYGIKTAMVVANAKNCERVAYQLLTNYGFKIYNYVPKTKPDDRDTLVQFCISYDDYIQRDYVAAGTYDYELPKILKSPYNLGNPIRKIDSIQYIKQPTGYLCGQAVIAMLANVSVDEVIAVMQNDKGTSAPLMREALKYYGIKTAKRLKYTDGAVLPECCILGMQLPGYGHWSLYYKDRFYDPEFGVLEQLPEQAKLGSYREVIC